MKHAQSYLMDKLQRSFSVSSLVWAALVTAIVLTLAASANAQSDERAITDDPARPVLTPLQVQERTVPDEPRTIIDTAPSDIDRGAGMSAQPDDRRAAVLNEIESRRAAIETKRAELASQGAARVSALREETRVRVASQTSRLTNVLELGINRLQSASNRLRQRANELRDRGVDVSAAVSTLNEADRLLSSAKDALYGIDVNVSYATLSETPREDWQSAREQFLAVTRLLTEARTLLGQAINELRRAVNAATEVTPND